MASIYKRTCDKGKKRPCWYIAYVDHQGKRRVVKGFTDRAESERYAAKLEDDARMIKAGLKAPPSPAKNESLESLTKKFAQHLRDRDVSDQQIEQVLSRIRRILSGCDMVTPGDISALAVERFLSELRSKGMGKQTSNHYVKALRQFCRWLVRMKALTDDPTAEIPLLNVQTDRRHDRRALSPEEFSRLIEAA
jgi:integrase